MTLNKRQLAAAAARRTDLTRQQTLDALEAILDTIADTLAAGGEVRLANFGRFKAQDYPGRELRAFDGQGRCRVETHRVPVFRPSAVLRRRLREQS